MTAVDRRVALDTQPPEALLRRFDIDVLERDVTARTVVMSMSLDGLRSPFTDQPSIAPLALLVDAVSGLANHFRREAGEWSVSSELTVELSADGSERATAQGGAPVVAVGKVVGPRGKTSLSVCTLTCDGVEIGSGSVCSSFVTPDEVILDEPPETLARTRRTTLAELMAVETADASEGLRVLRQNPDPTLNNAIGVVNGGIAAAGLELVASAAVNTALPPMRTASIRVNFLRPFFAGEHSRYEASPLRIGRGTAVADAQAVAEDGRAALMARVTAYR